MKRWIIRSLFIGLLLLCVGGYGFSYIRGCEVADTFNKVWGVQSGWGKLHLSWFGISSFSGLWVNDFPVDAGYDLEYVDHFHSHYCLGFFIRFEPDRTLFTIPFWFPTTISALLLWWVWRKTRPPVKGRAFPVEPPIPLKPETRP